MPSSQTPVPRQVGRSGKEYSQTKILDVLFNSKARAAVVTVLFGLEHRELYQAEIVRRCGMAGQGVFEQLCVLEALKLVTSRADGNRRYYGANREHQFYVELRSLVLKSGGLRDVLVDALKSPRIDVAFVFGSVARMEERPESDVDLMLFGDISGRELAPMIRPLHDILGRIVNPINYTQDEVARRIVSNDHFLTQVLASPRLFLIGDEASLAAWIEKAKVPVIQP